MRWTRCGAASLNTSQAQDGDSARRTRWAGGRRRRRLHVLCGKGCVLEFEDDPEPFLAVDYVPSM